MKMLIAAVAVVFLIGLLGFGLWAYMIRMPGKNFAGRLRAPSGSEIQLRSNLRRHVDKLAGEIGERNLFFHERLSAAAEYLASQLAETEYDVRRQRFKAAVGGGVPSRGGATLFDCQNLEVEIPGRTRPDEIIVVGAHYDSAPGTPGAKRLSNRSASVPSCLYAKLPTATRFVPGMFGAPRITERVKAPHESSSEFLSSALFLRTAC